MINERVFIGLGANMGDNSWYIRRALNMLDELSGVSIKAIAPLYKTAPLGYEDQDWFLNTVAELETQVEPGDLLKEMLSIEDYLGRKRVIHWGPRVIDLDLLLYGQRQIKLPELELPHPRMFERAFVMVPLADLVPDTILCQGKPVAQLAHELLKNQEIKKVEKQ
ncbi:MAG: 2-amino-4-hydroxy-6-hydroxymethyldihydropteridine diphosphokinase [Clostridiales bacterium]|nr:2-amino-4-hydroxy-6-hydroxymethyldihydropteridine diphosphokinase [Clostridiales bacterium]MCF8023745.1 2-amino-4-hydroxy-6-hydroxymethyldihydropteridine diphosphokinase [Clostridiales bacterium]